MGVTGLWTVVKPCARPIRLETLNKKRLAVDASIWIYHFLKAVRDKEGNALRNAHIVGFFRRICKLLYFGIKPVFVFDGGVPELKRQTIAGRRKRREGRQEDASKTAERLLTIQMQKKAEEEAAALKGKNNAGDQEEEPLPQEFVYAEEALIPAKERQKNRQFRKKDAYHLPELDVSLEEMGAPNDPRVMSHEDLEEYAKQFHSGEALNLYDFSKINFDSPFFLSLPASDRYNILNAARLRSRLRMGYSKDQLDLMFPNRMEFSKFQIERVRERNDLTQRLMNINGMNGEEALINSSSRIASERNKEYVLVKDSGVEGGWALGVLGNKGEGQEDKPIDVERYGRQALPDEHDEWEDEEDAFEDVPIEGLNRLPNLPIFEPGVFDESIENPTSETRLKSQSFTQGPGAIGGQTEYQNEDVEDDALFIGAEPGMETLFEGSRERHQSDDEDLCQAIQMSLNAPGANGAGSDPAKEDGIMEDQPRSDGEDDMDLFAAISKSKKTKVPSDKKPPPPRFDGLLPFEPLKRHRPSSTPDDLEQPVPQEQEEQPLPPWFTTVSQKKQFINQEADDQYSGVRRYRSTGQDSSVGSKPKPEIIDVDKDDSDHIIIDDDSPKQNKIKPASGVIESQSVPQALQRPMANANETSVAVDAGKNGSKQTIIYSDSPKQSKTTPPGGVIEPTPRALETTAREKSEEPLPDGVEDGGKRLENDVVYNHVGLRQDKPASPSPEFEDVSKPVQQEELAAPQIIQVHEDAHARGNLQNQGPDMYHDEDSFSDPEDAELMHLLSMEADEHARFASSLNSKSQTENARDYETEMKQLRSQQKKDRRDADEVSHIMVTECQQLLRLFGLPYITAPMEAEAQCAEMVSLGLVDGIVTDDSDIFLFGGNRVYKNMFNQAKYVECYLNNDLEKEYALDRQKLIRFAHLLGSDYTEGIPGVGPVTALEILTEFPTLEEFRDWWSQVQMAAKLPDDAHSTFRKKFKKKATKLFLPPSFPDKRVDVAYLEPEVDADPSDFQWGVPDLDALRQFLTATIGWSQERTDEVLVPVIRDVNRREQEGTQSNITNFFQGPLGAGAFAPRRRADGKSRMEKAFGRLRHEAEAKQKHVGSQANTPEEAADATRDPDQPDRQDEDTPPKARKKRRRVR